MQRIFSAVKTLASIASLPVKNVSLVNNFQQTANSRLLQPLQATINPVCGFKIKGKVRRRCKSCYFVVRDQRWYVICPKFPRHKQMAMKAKPLNTWVLTHASQSPVRPW